MSIPTLDYSQFTLGNEEQQCDFAHALLDSFERTGFCKLKCHSFSTEQLADLFGWVSPCYQHQINCSSTDEFRQSSRFFHQSLDVKNEIPNDIGPKPMRGYTPYRVEEVGKLSYDDMVRLMRDSKEHFDHGPESDTTFPNKWPQATELAGFKTFMSDFYRQCDTVCLTLMKALEVAWGITDGSLVARCSPSATDLRLTHYPSISVDEITAGNTCRIAPHTDFGPITLLFQDSCGGLEIEDRTTNAFVPLPPTDTSEMIINVGDTLTRWTNGKIFGGVHQVTAPEGFKGGRGVTLPPRMSMAYLFKAGRDISVGPLPKFVTENNPAKFPDMTALEFQRWRNSIVYSLDQKLYTDGGEAFKEVTAARTNPEVVALKEVLVS